MTPTRTALCILMVVSSSLMPVIGHAQVAADAPPPLPTTPLPPPNRDRDFVELALISPGPYALALGGGIIDEMASFPEEWTGGKGFGQRVFARVGSSWASDAIGHSAAALLRHHVRYEPCRCDGPLRRTAHALGRGFVTRHENGSLVMHSSVFIAKFGTAGLQNAWYPPSYTGDDVVREGLVGIAVNAALNVGREFSPELLRLIGLR